MTETQQTMTEFTYATGETDVTGDRFSPSEQYTAQTNSVLIQQQMLDQQRKATADDNPSASAE